MREIDVRLSSIKSGQFLFKPFQRSDNFHLLWNEACKEATLNKSKFIVLIKNHQDKDLEAIAIKLKANNAWLKQNSYLITKSGAMIVINFFLVRRYGHPGSEGFNDFLTWINEKVKSEGHRLAHIEESEFLLSKTSKGSGYRSESRSQKPDKTETKKADKKDDEAEEEKTDDKPFSFKGFKNKS